MQKRQKRQEISSVQTFLFVFRVFRFWNFLREDFFYFSSLGWKLQRFILGNVKEAFFGENIRKAFFWENMRIFLRLELESSIPRNKRNCFRVDLFLAFFFFGWIEKCARWFLYIPLWPTVVDHSSTFNDIYPLVNLQVAGWKQKTKQHFKNYRRNNFKKKDEKIISEY